jgi:hypothetical protein
VFRVYCRQPFPYRIIEELPVIWPLGRLFRPKSTKTAGYCGLALTVRAIG